MISHEEFSGAKKRCLGEMVGQAEGHCLRSRIEEGGSSQGQCAPINGEIVDNPELGEI